MTTLKINKHDWLHNLTLKQQGYGTVKWNNEWHRIENSKPDSEHIVTACGISTWKDLHETSNNNKTTCKRCQNAKIVRIEKEKVYFGNIVLFEAKSSKLARAWCYEHGSMGLDIRFGVCSTKIFYEVNNA